jgi:hypothetical protein
VTARRCTDPFERAVEVAVGGIRWPVEGFPARAEKWAPTASWEYAPLRAVTHLASGKKVADAMDARLAEILCAVCERILPGDTEEEVTASFFALPAEARRWLLGWKTGGSL